MLQQGAAVSYMKSVLTLEYIGTQCTRNQGSFLLAHLEGKLRILFRKWIHHLNEVVNSH